EMSDVLAAVLRQDVEWTALPAGVPLRLRRLLERCLERDVKQRLRDIGEARVEIGRLERGERDAEPAAPVVATAGKTSTRTAAIAALSLAAGALLMFAANRYFRAAATGATFGPPVGTFTHITDLAG